MPADDHVTSVGFAMCRVGSMFGFEMSAVFDLLQWCFLLLRDYVTCALTALMISYAWTGKKPE